MKLVQTLCFVLVIALGSALQAQETSAATKQCNESECSKSECSKSECATSTCKDETCQEEGKACSTCAVTAAMKKLPR